MFKQILLGLLALGALIAPAQAYDYPVTPEMLKPHVGDYSRLHTLGVITALGNNFHISRSGTFLDDQTVDRDITDWKLDELARKAVHGALGGRFGLIDIAVENAAADEAIAGNDHALRKYLEALGRTDVDAFLVVRKHHHFGFPGYGAGLSARATAGTHETWLYANYEIVLIDAKTFQEIAGAPARMRLDNGTPAAFPGILPIFPGKLPDQGLMPDDLTALNDAKMVTVKEWTAILIRLSVVETLRALEFGVALPRTGGRTVEPRPDNFTLLPPGTRMAIVSVVADTLVVESRALFSHSAHNLPIAGMNLDAKIEALTAAALDRRYAVVPAPPGIDRAKLASHDITRTGHDLLDGLPAAPDIDVYIVVMKGTDYPSADSPHVGLSLAELTTLDSDQFRAIASYGIEVVDAHTLKRITSTAAKPGSDQEQPTPERPIDEALWPEAGSLTAEQSEGLRKIFEDLLAGSLRETLLYMNLTGDMLITLGEEPESPRWKKYTHPQAADPDDTPAGTPAPATTP